MNIKKKLLRNFTYAARILACNIIQSFYGCALMSKEQQPSNKKKYSVYVLEV